MNFPFRSVRTVLAFRSPPWQLHSALLLADACTKAESSLTRKMFLPEIIKIITQKG